MTLQKNSADIKKYSSRSYYGFAMKQNWQLCVLFLILTLFIMLLSSYVAIDNIADWINDYRFADMYETLSQERIDNRVHDSMSDVSVIGILVSAALAFISGMSAMSFINSKKSVGCYHSFPIKRESMFVTETTIPMLYYLLSVTAGYAISYLMFLFAFDSALAVLGGFIKAWLAAILLYLFIYTVILLAGGLTGTSPMKLIVTLFLLFWPLVMYALIIYMLDINTDLSYNYYMSDDAMMLVSPFIRAIYGIVIMYQTGELAWLFPLYMSALMYGGALLLHKHRKSELSGTTVVWKPVFVFVKYAVIFAAAHLGALLFYYIGGESYVTMFFGMIFGAVVALMLMNAIMYRSTKAMFKDMKKFWAFLVAAFVFMLIVPLNVTGLIGKPYPIWNTGSAQIEYDGYTMLFEDKEDIETLVNLKDSSDSRMKYIRYVYSDDIDEMNKLIQNFSDYTYEEYYKSGYYDDYGFWHELYEGDDLDTASVIEMTKDIRDTAAGGYTESMLSITRIQKPYFGIPLAKDYTVNANGDLWEYISETEEYLAQFDLPSRIGDKNVTWIEFDLLGVGLHFSAMENPGRYNETVDKLIDACVMNPDTKNGHLFLGHITIEYEESNNSTRIYSTVNFPVYSCDTEILNLLGELSDIGYPTREDKNVDKISRLLNVKSEEDVLSCLMEDITSAALVNLVTWEAHIIEDRDTVYELLADSADISEREWMARQFVRESNSDYVMIINYSGYQRMLRFRPDTVSDAQLRDIFESLK